jgi:poly(beta-D-mannuronate) lyase
MKFKAICSTNVPISILCSITVGLLATSGQTGSFAGDNGARWFNKALPLFTEPNVPNIRASSYGPDRASEWGAHASSAAAQVGALLSPWDLRTIKVNDGKYSCPTVSTLPHDVEAFDYYSDDKHSIKDQKRYAAYLEVKAQYTGVSVAAERAADNFQATGNSGAAACVMRILLQQAHADAMTGNMSSNQANYVQNWTLGALAVTYLKVRHDGPDVSDTTPEQVAALQVWMKKVGEQVEAYFAARRKRGTTDGRNNHLYWAGFATMSAGIAVNNRDLYEWGVSTYKDGVDDIATDGTLPLEMARGQRALHYHLFALAPLVTMAEMAAANGDDLYSYNHAKLHLLVARSLAGLADNQYFTTQSGAQQDTPDKDRITSDDVIWVTPYVRRFPDSAISALLSRAGSGPYEYLGGMPPP